MTPAEERTFGSKYHSLKGSEAGCD
jgi:hypothetical protein